MMHAWSFAADTHAEVTRLLRAMGRHRYLHEASFALHWSVDVALADRDPRFRKRAEAFFARGLDDLRATRHPDLWTDADLDDALLALSYFWEGEDLLLRARLSDLLREAGIPPASHEPFEAEPEEMPFPVLVSLDWSLLPVDQLDEERHKGALRALETFEVGEEYAAAEPVDV